MQALLSHPKHGRLTVYDNNTFDRYIADGWSVISIISEENKHGKANDTSEKRPNEARQKRRRASLLHGKVK